MFSRFWKKHGQASPPGGDDLLVDDALGQLTAQRAVDVVERHLHAGWAALEVVADAVRCQDDPLRVAPQQWIRHVDRLLLKDVEGGAGQTSGIDGLSQLG